MSHFKQMLEETIIPRTKAMIEKEKDHLKFLESMYKKHKVKSIKELTYDSKWFLRNYERKLYEYTEYAKTLS